MLDTHVSVLKAIKAMLSRDGRVVVCSESDINWLRDRGYGEEKGSCLELKPHEALYLLNQGMLEVVDEEGRGRVGEERIVRLGLSKSKRFWTKYLVYRDLRSRGYVVRDGYGIGLDLRVYERGEYKRSSAKYLVLILNEGSPIPLRRLKEYERKARNLGKEPVLAVVERRGEIVYYKISRLPESGRAG